MRSVSRLADLPTGATATVQVRRRDAARVSTTAVLGMPNTGKSTLFNRLTGHHTQIGNWPGLTVDLMQAELQLSGHSDDEAGMFQGIYTIGVPVQEALGGLLDQFGQLVLKPLLAPLPALLQGFLLEGLDQGLGAVMAFPPGSPCSS